MSSLLSYFGFKSSNACSLEISRGCPFRCYYCVQAVKRERFRIMNTDNVIRHITDIVNTGVRAIIIVDDNLFLENCNTCPIAKSCDSPCQQVLDNINRDESEETYLYYNQDIEENSTTLDDTVEGQLNFNFEVPWDCINNRKREIEMETKN